MVLNTVSGKKAKFILHGLKRRKKSRSIISVVNKTAAHPLLSVRGTR